ncbi:MAG: hypothetical protein UHN47_03180 [Lachnospiraceae bacterium]|nr:hypothetical protein [Lachnospiraceae bacterium]
MFGNVVYYDKKKIDEYKSVIKGQKNLEVEEYEVSNDKGVQIDLKAFGADSKANKTYKAKVQESLLYNCDEFEKMLVGRDDFFDFTQSSDYDLTTMSRGYIIKFDGYVKVPQEFDYTQTIDKFKPMIVAAMVDDSMDKSEQAALKVFLETSDTKIPVLIDLDEQLMCSKLISNNMLVKYEEMEEYEELEVTIIARITSSNMISLKKAFYDPLKDFMTLNRVMRRSMNGRTEGLNEIFADKDYRTIEILAIYQ